MLVSDKICIACKAVLEDLPPRCKVSESEVLTQSLDLRIKCFYGKYS